MKILLLYNDSDIAHLLQIKPSEAKKEYLPNGGEIHYDDLKPILKKKSIDIDEMLERRKKVRQSQPQLAKITQNDSAIKTLIFPKSLRIYRAVLEDEDKQHIMKSWQLKHRMRFGKLSLIKAAEAAEVSVII